jgi:outer membrane protein assembly factor BamB
VSRFGFALLLLLVSSAPAAAAIAFVTSGSTAAPSSSQLIVTPSAATGSNNTVVVVVAIRSGTAVVSSITDAASGGSVYKVRTANTNTGPTPNTRLEVWSTDAGVSISSTSITVNLSGAADSAAAVASYSGVVAIGQMLLTNTSGTTISNFGPSTLDANNWVVGAVAAAGSGTFTQNTGTLREKQVANGTQGMALVDQTLATAGTSANWSVNLSVNESAAVADLELRSVASVAWKPTAPGSVVNASTGTNTCQLIPSVLYPGSTLVVMVAIRTTSVSAAGAVSDTAGNPYTLRADTGTAGTNARVQIFTAPVTSYAQPTVKVTLTGTAFSCALATYVGVTAFGNSSTAVGGTTATTAASIAVTTQDNNNRVVAGFALTGKITATATAPTVVRANQISSSTSYESGSLTDNSSATPASVTNAVTFGSTTWAAAALELRSLVCGAIVDPTYVAANAQSGGTVNIYWSSTNPVIVVRKGAAFSGEAPTNLNSYAAGSTAITGTTVVYNGSAQTATDTPGTGTFLYKVFAYANNSSGLPCYSPGTMSTTVGVNASPSAAYAWSYAIAGGSALSASIAGNGTLYTSSNAGRFISLNTANGTQSWAAGPTATNPNTTVQSWLSWIPISGSANSAVIGGDLGTGSANSATVYFVDSGSGAKTWTKSALTGNGADAIQAAASAQLWAYSNAAFQSAYQPGYSGDVVFVATRNASRTGNSVYALKATDGTVLWNFNASTTYNVDAIIGEPYVDYARNLLYVASKAGASNNQKNLWIIDSRNGTVVQQLALGTNHIQTSPTLSYNGNTLYVADVNGNLYAVNLTACTSGASCTATLKWTAPAALGSAIKDTGFVWEDYTTSGRLYFSTADGNVWCWQDPGVGGTPNVATACSGWSAVKVAVPGASTPLLLNNLFVSSWDGTTGQIYQINPSSGAIAVGPSPAPKQVNVGDGTKQPGDISTETGNEIFLGTTDGRIFKYNLTSGSL